MNTRPLEICLFCNCPTEKAGGGDGSLYVGSVGPFCEVCYGETGHAALEAKLEAIERQLRRIREWEHLPYVGIGPYWIADIDDALAAQEEQEK